MTNKQRMIRSTIAACLSLATTQVALAATDMAAPSGMEKCYGIVKAGLNDCASGNQSCAGSSTKDKQADAYLFLPTGTCSKIVGGKLTK